jgi:biopolymer transport protein ExbB/TolQ
MTLNIVEELLKIALLGSAWVLWLLIALSVLSLGLMIERAWTFALAPAAGGDTLWTEVNTALVHGDADRARRSLAASPSAAAQVVAAAFAFRDGGPGAFLDGVEAELARARRRLERGTTFLGTVGNNAPFIGLFGTVIGVIVAFQELGNAAGKAGGMDNVMSGIAEALVATGVGLFVALPAVIAYNVIQQKIGEVEQEAQALARLVAAHLGRLHAIAPGPAPREAGNGLSAAPPSAAPPPAGEA